ncbi:MAG: fimbrillin family protein [Parabacteroides gordonii]|nr:fimbrillin family protein [Parabacteroides gordonii]
MSNGSIDGLVGVTADNIVRTITNYVLPKQVQAGTGEDATHFIESASNPRVNGKTVSKKVGMLTYPIGTIDEGDLEAELTIGGDIFTARIPAGTWPAGTNTIYTIKASRRALEIISVDVTEWATEDGGEIDI